MDFQSRMRKMRLDQSNGQLTQDYRTNQNKKMYKLNPNKGYPSNNMDGGGGSDPDSGGEVSDFSPQQIPLKPHLQQRISLQSGTPYNKQPLGQMSSNADSGMDSNTPNIQKIQVQQTDSNTSTGSVSTQQHNANIKMELERKLAQPIPKRREVPAEFRKISNQANNEQAKNKQIKNKKDNYIKIKYPPLSVQEQSSNNQNQQNSEDEDSYIEDKMQQNSKNSKESTKHIYQSRDDFADDENDDIKSQGSSNQGHDAIETPIITNHDKSPIVESTDIISKRPVKMELSNKTSLGLNVTGDHNLHHSKHQQQLVTPDSGHSCESNSEKDCSCTCTSASGSEFQSSHHDCCSSQTNSSIKNIGNNNNNKKIIEAPREDLEEHKKSQLREENSLVPVNSNRNKQYVNNNSTKVIATYNNNCTQRAQNQNNIHNTQPSDYAYASKFANSMAKVPSAIKPQPTSKRVNGVTLRDLYSLRAVLSDSDNGTVFSGRRRIDNAAVAIKRIMKSKVKRWHMIKEKSVPMEIALLRKVNETRHAGVVTLLEWFECSDCFLLVMARPTPVLDLFDYVSEKKRLDENTCKMIFVQVVEAMVHCHQRSVLHRDIKLENILVKTDTLISTIIDFGCGTHLHSNLYKDFAGTPQYYPPEYYICKQYHGLPAAVWSVGVMLYAMLCGRLPFASAHEIVHLEPSWHGSFCRKISPAAKDLVEHMLKKQPRRRLQMQEILKHRWLKNTKYEPSTGNVTLLDENNNLISNTTYEKEPVTTKVSATSSIFQ